MRRRVEVCPGSSVAGTRIPGASAVQVGTATFWDPHSPLRIAEELRAFLKREGIGSAAELVGTLEL
jgi:dihydroorotate dehydrogenase (NAD+) catalytic subunit